MSFVRHVKLRVPAGTARPGPALGQALGPLGINMAEFCKQFNEKSQKIYKKDTPTSVILDAMSDRSFKFEIRSPPTSWLIKQNIGMKKGPGNPTPLDPVGFISPEAIYEIARIKQRDDLNWHLPLEGMARSIIGTANSMGVVVREVEDDTAAEQDVTK